MGNLHDDGDALILRYTVQCTTQKPKSKITRYVERVGAKSIATCSTATVTASRPSALFAIRGFYRISQPSTKVATSDYGVLFDDGETSVRERRVSENEWATRTSVENEVRK